MRLSRIAFACAALAAAWLLPAAGACAQSVEDKAQVCSACHGEAGVPVDKSIPVIWGQNEGYLYLELRDFKLGNRKNETMSQIAMTLKKQDMKDLAAYFAAKPWPNVGQSHAPADIVHRAEAIDASAVCKSCHLDHWQGASVTPRVGDQEEQYLRETMTRFRNGERTNNPWMAALLKTFSDTDIDAMAKYLAGY